MPAPWARTTPPLLALPGLSALLLPLSACPGDTTPGDDDSDLTIFDEVVPGSFVFTEIQANPNANRPEFLEIINASGDAIELRGCQIAEVGASSHSYDVLEPMSIEPGQYVLFSGRAYLGASEGELPVDVVYTELALNHNDPTESVEIRCPDGDGARQVVDAVAFDWGSLGVRRGHSWQLAVDADATANDTAANWCEAPTQADATYATVDDESDYGTPGGATVCETLGGEPPTAAGDVVIDEILVHEFDGLREWFELYNPNAFAIDVRDCIIGDAPVDGSSEPNLHTIDAELGGTVLAAGGHLLLSKAGTDLTSDGAVVADYPYSGTVTFNNDGEQKLWLACAVGTNLVTIDEVTYDWEDWGDEYMGFSLSLSASSLDATANDQASAWCLADPDDDYFSVSVTDPAPQTFVARGTPGTDNPACLVPSSQPGVGDAVITEIMVHSSTEVGANEEWFEVKNVSGSPISLDGCTIRDDNGDGTPNEHVIDSPLGFELAAGAYAVLSANSAENSRACGLLSAYEYSNIGFANDAAETLSLVCLGSPEVVVDSVSYDGGFTEGLSWQLRIGQETASANDSAANWCASAEPGSYPWSCTVDTDTNRGSPGQVAACP
jgi:hypothetical protein